MSHGVLAKPGHRLRSGQFWNWFVAHETDLWAVPDREDPWLDQLHEALSTYREGLSFELSDEEGGVRDLIVSASGDRDLFEAVDALVKDAPSLERWRIIPF